MPAAVPPTRPRTGITRFTNCRLVKGDSLVEEDLWVSSQSGKIVSSQAAFFDDLALPDESIDLGGRIISPGLIDVQLNGAFGFNFSTLLEDTAQYGKKFLEVKKGLVATGVTSFLPTLTSQTSGLYQKVLPYLGPSRGIRRFEDGSESLGAHVEGPFLNPAKNGIHSKDVLLEAQTFEDIEACYGKANLGARESNNSPMTMVTVAPERGQMSKLIPELRKRGIICSIGHSAATYEEALVAIEAGATMITHLFNAMRPLHHRNPGIFGVLGAAENLQRPYFGVIADGIHLHPTTVNIAFNTFREGFILVTDAMHMMGLPDGAYQWTNGDATSNIVKVGPTLLLEGTDTIAGSSISLIECVNNFLKWSGTTIPAALKTVTATPAAMLGCQETKGSLNAGADADLVIFSEQLKGGTTELVIDEVWKFGNRAYCRGPVKPPHGTK
ncbi:N-acetylglucosamine-6-phosphate deacetylase [Sodiomyces alkalinus F11]|uniref:N-acetylglucosamine-6-phosphate deacetylase n=1 Tax=Sodiomyces alkalinus (strain CBS 110278 / VKM F-3762 / F11) TaxID=1314773 RepID=A0A3N2PP46_SODAK|nr:N-acetylglucosamine-6-phosphate deacetylase [Sodiomyces alkalinus F11]ROT36285.1 N-acetylglucosamine-6-phosphate deacetylase [Sodiomyces alkalinus F11]